jgi:arylformamidase
MFVYDSRVMKFMRAVIEFGRATDLTHTIFDGMTTYVGDPKPSIKRVKTLDTDGVNLSRLTLGSHTGTHIDAPFHFINGGKTVDQLEADSLCAEAVVLDFSQKSPGSGIGKDDLSTYDKMVNPHDIVLLYTGMSRHWKEEWARRKFIYLTEDGADWMVKHKVRAVGIDYLSVEKFGSTQNPAHKKLLENGILIIESLNENLSRFLGRRIILICLFVKTKGTDGAPARALAYPLIQH